MAVAAIIAVIVAVVSACTGIVPVQTGGPSNRSAGETIVGSDSAPPIPTKAPPSFGRVAWSGWSDAGPTVSIRPPVGTPPVWEVHVLTASGWSVAAQLPDGAAPMTDGPAFASVADPASGGDVLVASATGSEPVDLGDSEWVHTWRANRGLAPVIGGTGFLLLGAPTIAIVDDSGSLSLRPVPDGFVALAPTSDPSRFLLARTGDAAAPGGLTSSSPFGAFLWTVGSNEPPVLALQRVVAVAESGLGLSWLLADDGAWWSIRSDGTLERKTGPSRRGTALSPDGGSTLLLAPPDQRCAMTDPDPCPVELVDATGTTQTFVGPSVGGAFRGNQVGFVLTARPLLGLPWRLVVGPIAEPSIIPIE